MTQQNDGNNLPREDYLNTDNDKVQDASNADAAKFNADEQEQAVNERQSSESSSDDFSETANGEADVDNTLGEELGGATNLSLDQLKEQGDPEGEE